MAPSIDLFKCTCTIGGWQLQSTEKTNNNDNENDNDNDDDDNDDDSDSDSDSDSDNDNDNDNNSNERNVGTCVVNVKSFCLVLYLIV